MCAPLSYTRMFPYRRSICRSTLYMWHAPLGALDVLEAVLDELVVVLGVYPLLKRI